MLYCTKHWEQRENLSYSTRWNKTQSLSYYVYTSEGPLLHVHLVGWFVDWLVGWLIGFVGKLKKKINAIELSEEYGEKVFLTG